jgi:tetratricopeptide (TPR) repeat protein
LTLLARAVALLPHDRTADQRALEEDDYSLFSGRLAWLPPVLACAGLGLQISFWENATAMTGEMLDLLIIAYVVRNLLEFRVDGHHPWIYRGVFVYALGITNNWALIGLAPVLLMAIIWIKGLGFFNLQFLLRLFGWGFVGLLLYLLLPLVMQLNNAGQSAFTDTLLASLRGQKQSLGWIYGYFRDNFRFVALAATSLLPLFFIALRWRSSFGDSSPIGIFITKSVFHIVHALFFGVCLLVLFSPPWSPRQQIYTVIGSPFLAHSYLSALVIGYCAGYFLIVCSPAFRAKARLNPIVRFVGYVGFGLTTAMLLIVPAGLLYRNLHSVRLTNATLVDDYVQRTAKAIPSGPTFIISDDPRQLAIMRSHLIRAGKAADALFYDTRAGAYIDYHVAQLRNQPNWPKTFTTLTNQGMIRPLYLIGFLMEQAQKRSLVYLQPSFGYYFERFEINPLGTGYQLSLTPTNTFRDTPPTAEAVKANEQFWADFDRDLLPTLKGALVDEDAPITPRLKEMIYTKFHLTEERNLTAEVLARHYARASTYWGVQAQKLGQWDAAAKHFERALALAPTSIAAEMNAEFNASQRAGKPAPAAMTKSVEDRFGRYNDWNSVISDCGPFDDPRFTFEQARVFLKGGLYRQAYNQFIRATELEPQSLTARLWLADVAVQLNQPAEALQIMRQLRSRPADFGLNNTNEIQLVRIEAAAKFRNGQKDEARDLLERALKNPNVPDELRLAATQLYLQHGLYAEAIVQFDVAIARNPADVLSQANRGYACLQLDRIPEACESLSRAIELDPANNIVRLNRAIALFRAGRYDQSRSDYNELLASMPDAYQVHYGLGELDYVKQDRASALKHYERYLELAPRQTPEYLQVSNRVTELKAKP